MNSGGAGTPARDTTRPPAGAPEDERRAGWRDARGGPPPGRRGRAGWRARLARRGRDAPFYAAIGVTALLVALTLGQISRHATAQRTAMRQALQDKALDAAMVVGDVVATTDVYLAAAMLGGVQAEPRAAGAPPRSLADLARHSRERMDSAGVPTDSLFGLFRIDAALPRPTDAALEATGAARDPQVRAVVLALLERYWSRFTLPAVRLSVSNRTVGSEPVRIHIVGERGTDGRVVAVYGVVVPRRPLVRAVLTQALAGAPLLPAGFYGHDWHTGERVALPGTGRMLRLVVGKQEARHNGLLAIQVADTAGRLLHETPGAARVVASSRYAAELVRTFDNLVVRVAFGAAQGELLVAATVPAARDQWLMAGVAVLGALFVAAAILELRRQRQLAEERRNFVAAISHELRTPLAHVAVLSETLLGPGARSEEQLRRWLGVIHREAHRLARLVDNVLLHARGDARGLTLDPRWVDAGEVVRDVIAAMGDVARARRVRLAAAAPARCPAWADADALRQVLINLVDNAVKHGPDGQTVTVTVTAPGAAGRTLTITVDDEGPGVAPTDRRRIWRPFVRLGDRGGATGGSGLGLSVVRDLVLRHGGRVDVTRAPAGGARFVVELPQPARPVA